MYQVINTAPTANVYTFAPIEEITREQLNAELAELSAKLCAAMADTDSKLADLQEYTFSAIYGRKTVKQLRAICKERGLRGYSRLRKAELLELLWHN